MEELSATQRTELLADLRALRVQLDADICELSLATAPVAPDEAIGRITRMDAIQMQQMAQANLRTARRRLTQITTAMKRAAADCYGECVECGDDIGYPRLKARPETPFCLDCQSRREQRR